MSDSWYSWQVELLDDYILGYTQFNSQEELAEEIGKSINAVKIKLSRRRLDVENEISKRKLSLEEYKIFLSNRFDKNTYEVAALLNSSRTFLIHELDEIDCLECSEMMEYERELTSDEYMIFLRLYIRKKKNKFQIAHILNRPIGFIEEMVNSYAGPISTI